MKKTRICKLLALTFSLALIFALSACSPEIHVHTDEAPKEIINALEESALVSTKEMAEGTTSNTDLQTSVASFKSQTGFENPTASKKAETSTLQSPSSSTETSISKSKAKSIALKDAGFKASEIYDYEIELDRDNGVLHYDVSFEYKGKDYDYEVNAVTGKIIDKEIDD